MFWARFDNRLTLSNHIDNIAKNPHHCFNFLSKNKKFGMSTITFSNFCRDTIEGILSGCIVSWYLSSGKSTSPLPPLYSICCSCSHNKAANTFTCQTFSPPLSHQAEDSKARKQVPSDSRTAPSLLLTDS